MTVWQYAGCNARVKTGEETIRVFASVDQLSPVENQTLNGLCSIFPASQAWAFSGVYNAPGGVLHIWTDAIAETRLRGSFIDLVTGVSSAALASVWIEERDPQIPGTEKKVGFRIDVEDSVNTVLSSGGLATLPLRLVPVWLGGVGTVVRAHRELLTGEV